MDDRVTTTTNLRNSLNAADAHERAATRDRANELLPAGIEWDHGAHRYVASAGGSRRYMPEGWEPEGRHSPEGAEQHRYETTMAALTHQAHAEQARHQKAVDAIKAQRDDIEAANATGQQATLNQEAMDRQAREQRDDGKCRVNEPNPTTEYHDTVSAPRAPNPGKGVSTSQAYGQPLGPTPGGVAPSWQDPAPTREDTEGVDTSSAR